MDALSMAGLVKRIYPSFHMENFDNRLKLQKIVFLMRYFGLDLGYSYNLYLRGPYSPALARDAFIIGSWTDVSKVLFESRDLEQKFKNFKNFIAAKKTDGFWLERVATLAMLKEMYPAYDDDSLVARCKQIKPQFGVSEIRESLEVVKSARLVG